MAKLHNFNKVALIQHSKHAVNGRFGGWGIVGYSENNGII